MGFSFKSLSDHIAQNLNGCNILIIQLKRFNNHNTISIRKNQGINGRCANLVDTSQI